MKTALVTGHLGFVGRHMSAALEDLGYHVLGLDIRDQGAHDCRDYFRKFDTQFDLVVHCAAVVGGRTMIDGEPLRLAVEDLSIDAEMFRWALRTRPGRIVYFSSSAAYPVHMQTVEWNKKLSEGDINLDDFLIGRPDQTYGWVKLTGEQLAREANAEGIRTHVFRPFSGYGADQDLSYPFPSIMSRAAEYSSNRYSRIFEGEGYATPESFRVWGHKDSTRDWVHISDVVGCVMAAIDNDFIGPVNICTGVSTSFESLALMSLKSAGLTAPIEGDSSKPMGVFHRVGDPTLMRSLYTPKVEVETAVDDAIRALLSA